MQALYNLWQGFAVAITPTNILWLVIGSILGTVLGMLPGIGPSTGVALLLPMTFAMDPATALITMCAIYYGAMFGGSRSSILLNVPGDGASIATCFDGYPMAQNGEAEAALAISGIASFIGGTLATIAFVFIATSVAGFALKFGPPEYFTLMIFALAATVSLSKDALLKGILSMIFGLMITTVGIDLQSGVQRFTFGVMEFMTGIDFVVVLIGIFGISEVFKNFETIGTEEEKPIQTKFGRIWVNREQWRRSILPIIRQTPVGFFVGVLPGAGG
ncbi:MAG: tripartite tricarboxylate transporter permease, partial [Thermoanaerobacteraceae bacterium]|nr:tripartite tricarboxylate transporter permease [Thermoanaerobacteraceae bacterium]